MLFRRSAIASRAFLNAGPSRIMPTRTPEIRLISFHTSVTVRPEVLDTRRFIFYTSLSTRSLGGERSSLTFANSIAEAPVRFPHTKNGGNRKIRRSLISSTPTARYFSNNANNNSLTPVYRWGIIMLPKIHSTKELQPPERH